MHQPKGKDETASDDQNWPGCFRHVARCRRLNKEEVVLILSDPLKFGLVRTDVLPAEGIANGTVYLCSKVRRVHARCMLFEQNCSESAGETKSSIYDCFRRKSVLGLRHMERARPDQRVFFYASLSWRLPPPAATKERGAHPAQRENGARVWSKKQARFPLCCVLSVCLRAKGRTRRRLASRQVLFFSSLLGAMICFL